MVHFKFSFPGDLRFRGMRKAVALGTVCALSLSPLERAVLAGPPFLEFADPNPAPGNRFGTLIVPLSTGNVVITSPFDDAGGTDAGAVYLFSGATGALISTLTGTSANDNLGSGGIVALTNGNFVVVSPLWDNALVVDAGAVTWGSGTLGVAGAVSPVNSLVGTTVNDAIGSFGVAALSNGNYVVRSPEWDSDRGAPIVNAGAVTWGSGTLGVAGAVTQLNSLVGGTGDDRIGNGCVATLSNGNYVVRSSDWDNGAVVDAGAVTWVDGATGRPGLVSASNSLVGTTDFDVIGIGCVTALRNGNYVVVSPAWDNGAATDAGAVTWGSGTAGVFGPVSALNSVVGSTAFDVVGIFGIAELTQGNFVVSSPLWDYGSVADVGAATFVNGATGFAGAVTDGNSLVGSTAGDLVSFDGITALANGNYVVRSATWDDDAAADVGAVTWGSGSTGIAGIVSAVNSLVGTTTGDVIGIARTRGLSNGNYVVASPLWDGPLAADVGAVTWGNGATGTVGAVTEANSLVGKTLGDHVGGDSLSLLTNGNYVVASTEWDGADVDVGAATWGNGASGTTGEVNASNSLVGSTAGDNVGNRVTALSNGNYVVASSRWDGAAVDAGAATFGNGSTGLFGAVSPANSLVGSVLNDRVGQGNVTALTNGNYVVESQRWNGAGSNRGAVTFGSGSTGVTGEVTASNSLIGSRNGDRVGVGGVTALPNGNYVVLSPSWRGVAPDSGAATWGSATSGVSGAASASNSLTGSVGAANLQPIVLDAVNGTFLVPFLDDVSGKVRVGSQADGSAPTLGPASASGITTASADLAGSVTSDNGFPITSRGFVYSITAVNSTPVLGGTGVTQATLSGTTGAMNTTASGLSSGTSYSFRGYATSAAGTSYSSVVTFTTVGPPLISLPTSTSVTGTGATLGANVTADGGTSVTQRGVVYALTAADPNPVSGATGVTTVTVSGTTGVFTTAVTGLATDSGYSFRGFATNAAGTTYTSAGTFKTLAAPTVDSASSSNVGFTTATLGANVTSDGGAAITQRGFVYAPTATDSNPLLGSAGVTASVVSGTTGLLSSSPTGLASGVSYTFKAFATNSVGTSYTSAGTFVTLALPAITGASSSNVGLSSATLGANVTSDGGSAITQRGFVYSLTATDSNPVIGNPGVATSVVSGTTGSFASSITALTSGAAYSFKGFATSGAGTAYTSVGTFQTFALPVATTGAATNVAETAATLNGSVNPAGFSTTARFEYGLSMSYGNQSTASPAPGTGSAPVNVSAAITGLTCSSTYHFRVVATSAGGATSGADRTFTTATCPGLAIDDPSIVEGAAGSSILAFTVSIPQPLTSDVRVDYATVGGTATPGDDYTAASGVFILPAGTTSKTLTVVVRGETAATEPDETLTVVLTNAVGISIGKAIGTGTIVNDDPPAAATTITQYRLYHAGTLEHLYTTDLNEYNVLGANGWTREGVAYKMLTNGIYNGVAATIPMFRLYHPGIQQHHWTTDANEAITLAAVPQWYYEGTIGYLLATQALGTVPLYRLSLHSPPIHLWTTDQNEYETLAAQGWTKEGIIGYVVP
jgi:hypothetical protein